MTTPASRARAYLRAARHLPSIMAQTEHLARDHQLLIEQVRRDEQDLTALAQQVARLDGQVSAALAALDRMHETLVDADPRMAYDVVTAVRDDVRSLLVAVTEQANEAAARRDRPRSDAEPAPERVTDS